MEHKLMAFMILALTAVSSACESTGPEPVVAWGSDQAALRIAADTATLHILAAGGCYGSWGEIDHAIPAGAFTLSGTYTQLMGAYPGSIQYAAEYAGTIAGNSMTLSINIPALQQTIGPFHLTAGVTSAWTACLYP